MSRLHCKIFDLSSDLSLNNKTTVNDANDTKGIIFKIIDSFVKYTCMGERLPWHDCKQSVLIHNSYKFLLLLSGLQEIWVKTKWCVLSGCFPLCQNFRKCWSRNKWNALVRVEIFRPKWSTCRGGPLWPVSPIRQKRALPFPQILVSSPTLLSSSFVWKVNESLDSIWNFVSTEKCTVPFSLDNSSGF